MKTLKKLIIFTAMLLIMPVFQSCYGFMSERISGDGNVKKEDRKVGSFNSIDIAGTFNVFLSQGETEAVTIEADENLIPLLETRVENNTLYIDVQKDVNIGHASKKNVYITLKNINSLKLSSVGNIETSNTLNLQNLDVNSSAVGNLSLDLNCNQLDIDIHSVGNSTFKGKAENVKIKNSSVGNAEAAELIAGILKINNSSVGNVEVYAEKEIYINSSGVGNLTFFGNAVVKEMNSSGVGRVKKG